MKITISGFGKLFFILKEKFGQGTNVDIEVPDDATINTIFNLLSIETKDVEAVFINGKVKPMDTPIKQGDRIGLIPYGVPGPYRFLLNIKKVKNQNEQ